MAAETAPRKKKVSRSENAKIPVSQSLQMNAKTHHQIQSYLFFLIQELKDFRVMVKTCWMIATNRAYLAFQCAILKFNNELR
jgi:hypothetical protein